MLEWHKYLEKFREAGLCPKLWVYYDGEKREWSKMYIKLC